MVVTCVWCGTDVYVEYHEQEKVAVCYGSGHPTERVWEPAKEKPKKHLDHLPEGIAAELGLYDDLPECLSEGEWAETGVVEHRYGELRPDVYGKLVDRWGHTAMGPRKYSVTSFIGSTLGDLSRHTDVGFKQGKGTGFFSYNSSVGMWTLLPEHEDMAVMSWERLAEDSGFDPGDWPLLEYKASEHEQD